jgi:hypothetical protein
MRCAAADFHIAILLQGNGNGRFQRRRTVSTAILASPGWAAACSGKYGIWINPPFAPLR